MSRVVVIGGGVIGLSCAYHLARQGHQIVLLDRGDLGGACSSGNLGWVVPSLSEPLPAPGLTWASLKWMLSPDSPLYIDPRFAVHAPGWLWRFWRHCNSRDYARGLEAIAALNRPTFELYERLRADGVRFELHRQGLLFLFLTRDALEESLLGFERLAALGQSAPEQLSRDAVLALEPSLSPRVQRGVFASDECHVQPSTLCAGLVERLRGLGAAIYAGVEVTGAERRAGRLKAVHASGGPFDGDVFLIAAGAWSERLARRFGFQLPVKAGKGYSVTITQPAVRPNRPFYLYERRVGVSPFDSGLRLGGTMELSGNNGQIPRSRIAAIRRAAELYCPGSATGAAQVEWTGMRPLTPDGLPAIGRAPGWDNLYVATGHAMLGVTLAPVTGLALAELIAGGSSSFDLRPFDPGRFALA